MTIYAVAMSGGVDSSTVAALLLREGHEVFGVTMLTQATPDCQNVINNASKVAKQLNIKHYVLDIIDDFKKEVIDYFISAYLQGTTPNPCAICNKKIKLSKLLMFAKEKGADYLATGHYASIDYINNTLYLKESKNLLKDQSYFLSLTDKEHLKYIKTPLSNITNKLETRTLAKQFGLSNFQEKDSQDICFIKHNDYISFIKDNIKNEKLISKRGDIILQNTDNIIAQHNGLMNYTIGQRKGIGISYSEPLYVINMDYIKNQVTVGTKKDLLVKQFKVKQMNWLLEHNNDFECYVKVRSGHSKFKALINIQTNINNVFQHNIQANNTTKVNINVEYNSNICENNNMQHNNNKDDCIMHYNEILVNLLEPNTVAICPGQVCALYNEYNTVIGAGIIENL